MKKKIYLVRISEILKDKCLNIDDMSIDDYKKRIPLSIEGEKNALELGKKKVFEGIDYIVSSSSTSAISTAKYIAASNKIILNISTLLNELTYGEIYLVTPLTFKEGITRDYDFSLNKGESLNQVIKRAKKEIKNLLNNKYENIVVVTHEYVILAILSLWAEKDYNYNSELVLTYKDNPIYNMFSNDNDIICLEFDDQILTDIKKYD